MNNLRIGMYVRPKVNQSLDVVGGPGSLWGWGHRTTARIVSFSDNAERAYALVPRATMPSGWYHQRIAKNLTRISFSLADLGKLEEVADHLP